MKKRTKTNYSDEEIQATPIGDFLPPPEKLVLKKHTVKVTLSLTEESLNFFKEKANEAHIPYQKMIRNLLDQYANHYSERG